TVRLWDARSGEPLDTLQDHKGWVRAVAVTSDGTRIVSGGHDGTVRLWDARSGEPLHTFRGHEGAVYAVAVTNDGTRIASGGEDGTVRLWPMPGIARWAVPIAGYLNDRGVTDQLGMVHEAEAMARVAASRDVPPPLAVGVFGDWGTGKSFFLDRVREHIDGHLVRAGSGGGAADSHRFHSGICQVTFNAWHYIEDNLWASLVERIFARLQEELGDESETVFGSLRTAHDLELDAVREYVRARRRRVRARDALVEAEQRVHEAREHASGPDVIERAWTAFVAAFSERTGEPEKGGEYLGGLAERLGLPETIDRVEELHRAARESSALIGEARVIWRSVASHLGRRRTLVWVLGGACGVGAVTGALALILLVFGFDPHRVVIAAIGVVGTGAAGLTGVITFLTQRASGVIGHLKRYSKELDAAAETARQKVVAEPEAALHAAEAALGEAERQIEEAHRGAADAERRVTEDDARTRMQRFIRDRLGNKTYAKHLGLISTIRQDFEQLSELIGVDEGSAERHERLLRAKKRRRRAIVELLRASDLALTFSEARRLLEGGGGAIEPHRADASEEERPPITRIILYIDDLDRCAAERVVEVLQAVHLLLSFRLCVVFVAVDARWVTRSLRTTYPGLVTKEEQESDDGVEAGFRPTVASPNDYMEKIFQIPYWVRPMSGEAGAKLATSLIDPFGGTEPDDADTVLQSDQVPGPERVPKPPPDPTPDVKPGVKPDPDPEPEPEPERGLRPHPKPVANTPVFRPLALPETEREMLGRMSRIAASTPRNIKRFINTYWVIRSSLQDDSVLTRASSRGMASRTLAAHLAIAQGASAASMAAYMALVAGASGRGGEGGGGERGFEQLVDHAKAAGEPPKDWRLVMECLEALRDGVGDSPDADFEVYLRCVDRFDAVVRRFTFKGRLVVETGGGVPVGSVGAGTERA
ncbi:MAG: P-loop NTPase fold protein, partial [Planctomycetota bacterium]